MSSTPVADIRANLTREELLTLLDIANETVKSQQSALRQYESAWAMMPRIATALVVKQHEILVEVDAQFVRCPHCDASTPVCAIRRPPLPEIVTCGTCAGSFRRARHETAVKQWKPLSEVAFDEHVMPAAAQGALFASYLRGERRIQLRCAECGALRQECRCAGVLS